MGVIVRWTSVLGLTVAWTVTGGSPRLVPVVSEFGALFCGRLVGGPWRVVSVGGGSSESESVLGCCCALRVLFCGSCWIIVCCVGFLLFFVVLCCVYGSVRSELSAVSFLGGSLLAALVSGSALGPQFHSVCSLVLCGLRRSLFSVSLVVLCVVSRRSG